MPLTRDFRATVIERAERDPAYRAALLREGVELLLSGDLAAGKAMIRDYISATGGFAPVATATGHPAPSLVRMFGPRGNPRAGNLLAVIGCLQEREGVKLAVEPKRTRAARKGAAHGSKDHAPAT